MQASVQGSKGRGGRVQMNSANINKIGSMRARARGPVTSGGTGGCGCIEMHGSESGGRESGDWWEGGGRGGGGANARGFLVSLLQWADWQLAHEAQAVSDHGAGGVEQWVCADHRGVHQARGAARQALQQAGGGMVGAAVGACYSPREQKMQHQWQHH